MARYQAQQLPLPCTLADAAQLKEEVTLLRSEVQRQHATIHALQEQLDATQADCEAKDAELRKLKLDVVLAQSHLLTLQLQMAPASAPPRAMPAWLSQELRRLLTMAHPDKWSQGQPATALAHEVTIALNALRTQCGEGQA